MRRDRACRSEPALFLYERSFDDVLDRLDPIRREFSSILLVGCPDAGWPDRLRRIGGAVTSIDPGALFASAAGGRREEEDSADLPVTEYDLCVAIGTLDTVNDLPQALLRLRLALKPGGLLIGAMSGADTLPRLREAMRAADEVMDAASPHAHPRIDPAGLAGLLSAAGFTDPVVDIDRVQVSYRALGDLVRDIRGMGAGNILTDRSRTPLSRAARDAATRRFAQAGADGKTTERFDILHFAGWSTGAQP